MTRHPQSSVSPNFEQLIKMCCEDSDHFLRKTIYVNPVQYITGEKNLLLDVQMVFSEIVLEESKRSSQKQPESTNENNVSHEDILQFALERQKEAKTPAAILLEGPAGVGKTTFLKLVKSHWSSGGFSEDSIKQIEEFQLLVAMECRDLSLNNFTDLLRTQWPNVFTEFTEDEVKQALLKFTTLFLVDGLDEANESTRKIFKEILDRMHERSVLICTTRPEKVEWFYSLTSTFNIEIIHIHLRGISIKHLQSFLVKYHENITTKRDIDALLQYFQRNKVALLDFWRIPINMMFFVVLWEYNPEKVNHITTVSDLYDQINALITKKALERMVQKAPNLEFDELQEKFSEFIQSLQREALVALQKGEVFLAPEALKRLKDCCSHLGIDGKEAIGAFFLQESIWISIDVELSSASFAHKTMQEHHAARGIFNAITEEKRSLSSASDSSRLQRFLLWVKTLMHRRSHTRRAFKRVLGKNVDYTKFQNTLQMLLGYFYRTSEAQEESNSAGYKYIIAEVIYLLKESGLKAKDDWLKVINTTKCNDNAMKEIIIKAPLPRSDHIEIGDSNTAAYEKLITQKYIGPKTGIISIEGDPVVVPNLTEILHILQNLGTEIKRIYLHHAYRNSQRLPPSFLSSLNDLILRCCHNLHDYWGPMTNGLLKLIPKGWRMCIGVTSMDDLAKISAALKSGQHPLRILTLCIPADVAASNSDTIRLFPLNGIRIVTLYFPDVGNQIKPSAVAEIARKLTPTHPRKVFAWLCFPVLRCSPDEVVKSLQDVRVGGHLYFPSACKPTDAEEEKQLQDAARNNTGCNCIRWGGLPPGGPIDDWDWYDEERVCVRVRVLLQVSTQDESSTDGDSPQVPASCNCLSLPRL